MRKQYDFAKGVRGKYARRYAEGTNVVVLDPDLAKLFPDSKSVTDALRALASVASRQGKSPRSRRSGPAARRRSN
jgi:hypothetical protein